MISSFTSSLSSMYRLYFPHLKYLGTTTTFLLYVSTFQSLFCFPFSLSELFVCSSWNQATYDDSLWRSQFDLHFKHKFLTRIQSGIDLREAFKKEYLGKGFCLLLPFLSMLNSELVCLTVQRVIHQTC